MIARRVSRACSMDVAAATAAAAAATVGGQQQRRRRHQQQVQRRRATTAVSQQHHRQQPGADRRRAAPVRSCSAVAERDTIAVASARQPPRRRSIAKRPSRVYRELCLAWNSRVGSQNTNAPAHRVQALFNDLGLNLTSAQVAEIMQCVMKCANRSSPVCMTFAEFCLLAKNLKNGIDRGILNNPNACLGMMRLLEKDLQEKHARPGVKKNSIIDQRILKYGDATNVLNYDVFLGGSCNPTTWRKDLAIPYLQKAGVSFYNPQVDHWSQDLIEIEHEAKKNATILFFVIDSQTRNVVTDIEIANFAADHTNLVLVIHPQDIVSGSEVAGERISSKEADDIKEALIVLHKITSHQEVLVFDNISQALSKIVQTLKEKNHQNMDTDEENTTTFRKIREAFNTVDTNTSGKISIFDVQMALYRLTDQNLSESEMLALMSEPTVDLNGPVAEDSGRVCFTFDQFYAIASKYLQPSANKCNCWNGYDTGGRTTYRSSVGDRSRLSPSHECGEVETTRSPRTTDVYLAGESGDDIRWTEDIAIPMIKKSNLTYHAAATAELSVILDARAALFVIPNNARSLATMTMAAYCMAKKRGRVVLCIQNLSKDDCVVRGEKLTQTAINDYNRGRKYLVDLAVRERVPVVESITEAVELAIQKCL